MSKARQNVDKLNDIISVCDYGAVSNSAGAATALFASGLTDAMLQAITT